MQLLINIPERQYNNIMNVDSVCLGRIPYKGIVMAAINGIKRGTVLPENARFINADEILSKAHIESEDNESVFAREWYLIPRDVVDRALVVFDTLEDES